MLQNNVLALKTPDRKDPLGTDQTLKENFGFYTLLISGIANEADSTNTQAHYGRPSITYVKKIDILS